MWAGVDPKTNKPWKADWIKKSEVSAPAIAEWEESKRAKGSRNGIKLKGIQLVVQNHSSGSSSDYQPTQSAAGPIADSSPVLPLHRSRRKRWKSAPEDEDEIEDSLEYRSLRASPRARLGISESPFVEFSQKSASFDRTEYLEYSDLPSSQPASHDPSCGQGGFSPPLYSQPKRLFRLATLHFDIDEEVPDSQPSFPSSAYISTVEGSADLSGSTVEGGVDKVNEGDDGVEDNNTLLAAGAQPRSPWNRQDDRYGDTFTDFLGPLLQGHPARVQVTESGRPRSKLETVSTQDEGWPRNFASQPAELDRSIESSLLHPPSRSPFPYTGLGDEDLPHLSLSDSAMADQQSFRSPPPHAGSQTPSSTGKLSLRERLAQARLGFNDAVSAFRANPSRTEALPGRESPSPALSARPPPITPQYGPLSRPTGQQASMTPSTDVEAEGQKFRTSPPLGKIPQPQSTPSLPSMVQSSTNAHPPPNPSTPQFESANFASQLQVSLSRLPGGDHEYAPSKAALTQINSYSSLPTSPKLGPGEHVVVVGMSTGQKEAYLQNINNTSRSIQDYCSGESQDDEQLQKDISGLLRTAGQIATHLDLATNQPLDWEQLDVGYALLHPKFEFLMAFFDAIRYQSLSIAILAEPGKTLDILELFLKGIKIRCRRADGFITVSQDEIDGSVNVLLCSTGPKGARVLGSYASLVIGLDSTFNVEDEQVEKFRIHPLNVGRLSPVLRLVAVNTIEHVMLFLPPQIKHYSPLVMSYVAILRHQAGSLPAECADEVKESSKNIAKIIIEMSENDVETKLVTPDIPALPIYETASQSSTIQPSAAAPQAPIPDEFSKVALEQEAPKTVSRTSSTCGLPPAPHIGDKRRWEETSQEIQIAGTEELPEKKRKVVNTLPTLSDAPDITHISDSQPTTQAPEDTQDQESSMDIDKPEQAVTEASRPVAAPVQEVTKQATKKAENSQDSADSLVVRENGDSEVTEPKDQVSGEGPSDSMEGLTYDQSEQAEEAPSENPRPIIPRDLTDYRPNVGLESNPKSTPEAPIEANSEAIIGQKPDSIAEQVDESGRGVVDGNMEQDDFEYPEFEKPLKLPPEITLLQLSSDQLRQLLIEKSRELHDWVNSTSRLQLRFEQTREEVKTLNSEVKHFRNQVVSAQERLTRLNTEVINLKNERKQLKQDLQQARAALLSSDKPDVVKMEELRAENAKLQEEVASLNRQLESTKSEAQYARDAYQEATREGGDRAKEAEELRRLNEVLERKADERVVKLRELQFVNQSKVKDQQIDKLKRVLAERDERIRRLELERNSVGYKGGRPLGTRATSVPRRGSPSTSRTSSPGPGTLPGNSALPAPVGRDHPTRPFLSSGRRSGNNNKE